MTDSVKQRSSLATQDVNTLSYENMIKMSDGDLIKIVQDVDAKHNAEIKVSRRESLNRDNAQSILIKRYAGVLRNVVRKWLPFVSKNQCDSADVRQVANEAMLVAIKDFDLSYDNPLISYAFYVMRDRFRLMEVSYSPARHTFKTTTQRKAASQYATELKKQGFELNAAISKIIEKFDLRLHLATNICQQIFFSDVMIDISSVEVSPTLNSMATDTSENERNLAEIQRSKILKEATEAVLKNYQPVIAEHFLKRFNSSTQERLRFKQLPEIFAENGVLGRNGKPITPERVRQIFGRIQTEIQNELKRTHRIKEISEIL